MENSLDFLLKVSVSSHQIFILENTKSHAVLRYIYHPTTNTNTVQTH